MNLKARNNLTIQLAYFKTFINFIPDALVWGYLSILIYKETSSLTLLFIERLVFFISLFSGFVITSFFLDKVGRLKAYRAALTMNFVALLLLLILKENLLYTFVLISIIHGISRGIYWPIEHSILTRNLNGSIRSSFINKVISLNLLINIAFPLFGGVLINLQGDYNLLLIFALILTTLALTTPFKNDLKEITNIRSSEIKKIFNKVGFKKFALTHALIGGFHSLYLALFLIIPFLFLSDELDVGILISFLGIIAAVLAYFEKNFTEKAKIRLGYITHFAWIICTILFAIFWNPVFLVIQSILNTFILAFGLSVRSNEDYKIRKKILGEDVQESTPEMNIIIESYYIVSRILVFGGIIIILSLSRTISENVLRFIILFIPVALTFGYHFIIKQAKEK